MSEEEEKLHVPFAKPKEKIFYEKPQKIVRHNPKVEVEPPPVTSTPTRGGIPPQPQPTRVIHQGDKPMTTVEDKWNVPESMKQQPPIIYGRASPQVEPNVRVESIPTGKLITGKEKPPDASYWREGKKRLEEDEEGRKIIRGR
jgi:hypothetical protein